MKLHLPKGLLVAVLAAITGFAQSAWGELYETLADQTHEADSIPTHSTSANSLTHLVYDNNPSDGRVVSNANIVVNSNLWVGPGAGNRHNAAQRPILVQLNGIISGSSTGRFKLNEYPSTATDHFVIYELTNSKSSLDGTIALESGNANKHADAQLNFAGVGSAYAKTTVDVNGPSCGIINIAGNTSLGGLTGTQGRVTSTNASNTLTLAGEGTYSYTGTLGSGSYHTYTSGDSSTTFGTADSAALNIVKSGSGTQTFTGAANLGSVTVEAGTLNLNGATTFNGDISVADDAALNIYSAVTLNVNVTGALSIVDMSGFQGYGQSSGSCTGGEVEGNGFLSDTFTIISSDSTTKEGVSIKYKGGTYTTDAAGAIYTQNKYVFYIRSGTEKLSFVLGAGADTIQTSAGTVLNIDTNETTAANHILPSVSGNGTVEIELADNSKEAAITGTSFAGFTGTVDVKTGQLYVGQYNNDGGAGAAVTVGAEKFIVRSGASLWTHVGFDNGLSTDIDLLAGSALRNRDGNAALSGDIRFNIVDPAASTPSYDANGRVTLSMFWAKTISLSGLISGDGHVDMQAPTQGNSTGIWKLTNSGNTFQGSYNLAGRTKLVLAAENAARNATINLNGGSSVATLELAQNATIKALNSTDADSVVTTTAAATLTVSEGSFAGILKDGSSANKLSLKKTGTGTLTLSGADTYTGTTTIENGILALATGGTYTLRNSVSGAGTLQVESGTTLKNDTKAISSDLVLNGGNATLNGSQKVSGNITIKNGSTLTAGGGDVLDYSANMSDFPRTITVEQGGELAMVGYRWSFGRGNEGDPNNDANYEIHLAGGTISRDPDVETDKGSHIDFFDNSSITISGTTGSISANIEIRGSKTLTLKGVTHDPDSQQTTPEKFEAVISGEITGDGSLCMSGDGTVTLSGANTYKGGTEITGGTLIVSEGSTLGTGDVTVNGGNLEVSGQNAITATNLNITNGTVTASYRGSGESVISHSTTVNVNAGGTLKLTGHDMLGWSDSKAPAKIVLESNNSSKVAKLHIEDTNPGESESCTMCTPIEMNGNAEITGNALNTYGTSLTVKKGTNKIKVATLHMRHNFEIAIAKEAVLTIESLIAPNIANEPPGDITKSGVGTLELTNTGNSWDKNMHVTGGTLRLVGAANLPGSVTMDSDTRLETGTGTIGNLTMADGSTLDADTAVKLSGTLTFNGVVNLDGAIKDALYAGEQTVKLFTGITSLELNGTTYDSTARVAYNPVDLEEVFTFDDLQEDKYQLHYSGGELFATLSVPEPATATLSLLALAGLCARRRRKS